MKYIFTYKPWDFQVFKIVGGFQKNLIDDLQKMLNFE